MTTFPDDPTPSKPPPSGPSSGGSASTVGGPIAAMGCLAALADISGRWLGVLDHAAQTYVNLKNSGLIDLLIGG